jgi:hypothetical protein
LHQIIYAMQFKGTGVPVEDAPGVLRAATAAPSMTISSTVGSGGVTGVIQEDTGESARFESEVRMTGDTTFVEDGVITFGEGTHQLRFSTVGQGYLGPSVIEGLSSGAVIWQIDSGEGAFAGATGYITSNFTVSADGEVTDNQFGVIFAQ